MADNTTLNAGAGGDVISTDDIAGVKVQRVKVQHGADGSATDVSAASPMPVDGSGVTQPVSGTVTANLGATDNAVLDGIATNTADNATQTTLAALNTKFTTGTVIGDVNLGATDNAVLDSIATNTGASLTDTELRASAVEVDLGTNNDVVASGVAAENAAVSGNPVLTGGRYDSSARTLGNGDVGAVALNASGQVLVEIAAGAGSGGTAAADDADFTAGTTSATPVMGAYQSTPTAVTDGDMGIVGITANRELKVSAAAGSAEKVDDAAFTLATDSVVMTGAIRDDTLSTLTAVEGDAVPFRVSSTGALHVTGAGGGTQYTVDDASPTTVTMAGVVRDDSLTTLTEVDGDATLLRVNSTGALHVTGGGGGTEYSEDAATPATIVGAATMMERDDALSTVTPAEGDWVSARATAEGALWTQDFNSDAILADTNTLAAAVSGTEMQVDVVTSALPTGAATQATLASILSGQLADGHNVTVDNASGAGAVNIQDGGNSITVDGTVAVTGVATAANQLPDGHNVTVDNGVGAGVYIRPGTGINLDTSAVTVTGALPAGTAAIGKLAANSGVDIGDVDVTSIAAGANLIGNVGIGVRTTGGATFYLNQDTSAVASVKASAGTLYSISCFNTHTAAVYLNLYNVASGSVTLGTTTPSMQFVVPTQAATANGAGFVINFTPGIAFGTAITVACATTFNGSTDPGTNLVITNITYA